MFLSALSEYRFLTTQQIEKLFFPSYDRARKRLWLLWQHGLIERHFIPVSVGEGTSQAIYSLNRNGAKIVAEQYGKELSDIPYSSNNFQSTAPLFAHTLSRNDFRISLKLACMKTQGIKLLFWQQCPKNVGDSVYITDSYRNHIKIPLVPDGYFGLNTPQGKFYFLVEIDRTVGYKTYGKKLKGYYQWFVEKKYVEKFGIDNIRVLTVTYPSRMKKLMELALKVRDDKKGCGIFWFTTFDQISLDEPENILCPIWRVAHQGKDGLHSLIQ